MKSGEEEDEEIDLRGRLMKKLGKWKLEVLEIGSRNL